MILINLISGLTVLRFSFPFSFWRVLSFLLKLIDVYLIRFSLFSFAPVSTKVKLPVYFLSRTGRPSIATKKFVSKK